MCRLDNIKRTTSGISSAPIHKSPIPVLMQAFLSSCCFFFAILALMIPVDEGSSILLPSTEENSTSPVKRGKFVGANFDSRDLYDAWKEIESEYHLKAFAADNQNYWKVLTTKEDAQVALMEHPSDPNCPYVRLTASIPVPVQDCWDFLMLSNWDKTMHKMDPFYEGVELHGEFNFKKVHMILARKRTQRILAFGKRDFVFLSVTDEPLEDGTWVSGTVSVQTPKIPRKEGYTRAFQDSIAFYKPILDNDGKETTQVTIVCRIDLNDSSSNGSGGWMPMWLYVKTIGATGARSVISMRNTLVHEQHQKQPFEKKKKKKKKALAFWKRSRREGHTRELTTTGKKWRLPRWGKQQRRQQDSLKETKVSQPEATRWLTPKRFGFGQS